MMRLRFLPVIAFVATFGFFFVDKTREARTVLRSGRGLAVLVAIVVGYLIVAKVVSRVVPWRPLVSVIMTAVVLGLAAWTVLPYYRDKTVNRTVVAGPVATTTSTTEPLGGTAATVVPDARFGSGATSTSAPSPSTTFPAPTPTAAAMAQRLSGGELRGIDHEARGTASLIRSTQGVLVVRLEDFAIEGAPDPVLYLAEGEDVRTRRGIKLGRLPGNRGSRFDVEVRDSAASSAGPGWTVLIWCERFAVPIANATQR